MEVRANVPSILTIIGLPGSGKSTLARRLVDEDPTTRVRINYDDLRKELYGSGWKFNREEEQKMKAVALERAEAALTAGKDVIVDNTNLTTGARAPWENLAKKMGVEYDYYELDTDIEECIERDKLRGKDRVGRAVIERFALFTGWISWLEDRFNPDRPFVIFDIDGTLADTSKRQNYVRGASTDDGMINCVCQKCGSKYAHERPPSQLDICESCGGQIIREKVKKDYGKFFAEVHLDEPKPKIVQLLRDFNDLKYNILIVSGRPIDPCGIPTEDWLEKYKIPYHHLFMRQGYDHRPDDIIKQEILDLLPKDRIAYVIDDRNRVVDMWRKNGLTCLQCAPGDF